MYTLGLSKHIYIEDVYSGCFPTHLSERSVVWVFHCISILKIWILATLLHICLKHMHPDNVHTHLCQTYVHLHIYVKYLFTSALTMCTLGVYLRIYLKDLSYGSFLPQISERCLLWVFPCTSI